MKFITNIVRFIVGVLFIFSGLIKAIDPLGLSYKMNEFFEKWNWDWAVPTSLLISVVMIAFEIFAGVALLVGWRPKLITRLLLLLIIFFTFLTGYAYLSGKFHSCGCFGDCIPITSGVSFTKDCILLVLIILLCFYHEKITPLASKRINFYLLSACTLASLILMFLVLRHLPAKDCLPYAEGKDLAKQMQPPPGAIPDSIVINYVYKKDGKDVKFDADHFPEDFNDSTYEYITREDVLVRKGNAEPAIVDFVVKTLDGVDTTQQILQQRGKYALLFLRDFSTMQTDNDADIQKITQACKTKGIPLIMLSNMANTVEQYYNEKLHFDRPVLIFDQTPMKTFLRAKTGVVIMNGSVIEKKYNIRDADKAVKELLK